MARKLESLDVDGIPVVGVKARFRNQFDVPIEDAYHLALDEQVAYVIFAKVCPPQNKEINDGMVRINALRIDGARLITDEDEISRLRDGYGISKSEDVRRLQLDFSQSAPTDDVDVVIRTPEPEPVVTVVAPEPEPPPIHQPPGPELAEPIDEPDEALGEEEVRYVEPTPTPTPEPEPEDLEPPAEHVPAATIYEIPKELQIDDSAPYEEEDSRPLPVVGPNGGRIVLDAGGQERRDPMLAKFLNLSRGSV